MYSLFLLLAVCTVALSTAHAAPTVKLPIEVFGPSGSSKEVAVEIPDLTGITHLYLRCNACGYHDQRHDNDPSRIKATVSINGGIPVALKHYTGKGDVVGNEEITILGPEKAYGGIGGGFRTVRFMLPVDGLRAGLNYLRFTHNDAIAPSIGFRIIELNFVANSSPQQKVLAASNFVKDDPALWAPPMTTAAAIAEGRALWLKRNHLNDPLVDRLNGPASGLVKAACADCHASNGRDLAYFNFSNECIVERARFHGLSRQAGLKIASYIRSLDVSVVADARPWNPPYQPGPGMDGKIAYRWAAGAGIDAVLEQDSDMHNYLFPRGVGLSEVKVVVNRKATLNMRELPIAMALPDWNQWLPPIHPDDALDVSSAAVLSDAQGNPLNSPYYRALYNVARQSPTPVNLGAMVANLRDWNARGADCYSAGPEEKKAAPFRALNGVIWAQSLAFDAPDLRNCTEGRENHDAIEVVELAKRGLLGWTSIKYWEIIHGGDLERQASKIAPINYQGARINVAEPRGWVVDSQMLFNRAPHFLGHNSRYFVDQDKLVGFYDTSAWYHLNLVLNSGYRQTMPSHFIYTLGFLQNLHDESAESQSYRFWATIIKMRQLQTNGVYGDEVGLDLRTAQPHFYYSDNRGELSMRSNVGSTLWNRLMTALIDDFVADAQFATAEDWANATNNSTVQPRFSQNFSTMPSDVRFDIGPVQGLNTYRLIPLLRAQGVRETTLSNLIAWCEKTWPLGPWQNVR